MAAEWSDANTRIVTELFAEQVRRGNRPNTHLNSVGYAEVSKRFQEMTDLVYYKTQLKNKWDKLKNEYGIWKKLMRKETGDGWNIEKGTIDQDSEWWKKAKAVSAFFCLWFFFIYFLCIVVLIAIFLLYNRIFQVVVGFKSKACAMRTN